MKLSKLKMPAKASSKFDIMSLDSGNDSADESNESPEEEAAESPEEQKQEEEEGTEQHNPELAKASDEDLLAEIRRRGLSAKAEDASKKPSSDDEYMS